MKQPLYCIRCEGMVTSECEPFGHVVLTTGETPRDADIAVCEFPDGFATCPPPEFDIDAWLETAEPLSDEELADFYEAYP